MRERSKRFLRFWPFATKSDIRAAEDRTTLPPPIASIRRFSSAVEQQPRAVRISSPLQTITDNEAKRTKELNITHRMLVAHIKAKFLAIGRGLTEFGQEFMAHLVITDAAGNSRTIGDALLPQYRDNIDNGSNKPFMLGEGN